jgi:hypothetical protein
MRAGWAIEVSIPVGASVGAIESRPQGVSSDTVDLLDIDDHEQDAG